MWRTQGPFLPAFLSGPDPRATAEVTDENYEMRPFLPQRVHPRSGSRVGLPSRVASGADQREAAVWCAAERSGACAWQCWAEGPTVAVSLVLGLGQVPSVEGAGARRAFLEEAPDPANSVSLCSWLPGLTA